MSEPQSVLRGNSGRSSYRMSALLVAVVATIATACGGSDAPEASTTADPTNAPEPTASPVTTAQPDGSDEPSATGSDDGPDSTVATSSTGPATTEPATTTTEPVDFGTVVVLAEEGVLADVLALGIPVVASSATVPASGFQGMGEYDTDDIEIFDYLSISLEELAAYRADVIITWEFIVDTVGSEALTGGGATLEVLPGGLSGREQLRHLGETFGRTAVAESMIAELDAAYEAGRDAVPDDCDVSVVAIYAGANVAAFAKPIWDVPRALDELGCDLVPGPDEVETDGNGRAFLSYEQLGLLAGTDLIMLQTETVEGERAAVADIESNPLWALLPAVVSERVTVLDRLGYSGVTGEIRLIADLIAAVADQP